MDRALGLIEVIGYPPAIEAADAALKAANIKLGGITKVGSGIVTIQLFGDVGAIKAAVEAGGESASRIGKVRATHIIPRVDESLIASNIIANKENSKMISQAKIITTPKEESTEPDITTGKEGTTVEESEVKELEVKEPEVKDGNANLKEGKDNLEHLKDETNLLKEGNDLPKEDLVDINHGNAAVEDSVLNGLTLEEIKKKSITELKDLIQSLGKPISSKKLNSAKKEDLIKYITDYMDKKKGEV